MSTALPTPSPPEGSWMITEEYTGARQMLSLALDEKRSSPPKDAAETYIYGGPGAHLMMLTTIERIYLLAPTISEEDLLDYLGFVEASMYILAEHHKLEEDFIFPEIDRITDTKLWSAVRDEHSLFVPHFTALWHYARHIRSLLSQPNPSDVPEPYTPISDIPLSAKKYLNLDDNEKGWDGLSVQKHLDSFMTDFMKHIRLEHETSSLENVRQAKEADVAALDKALKMRAFKSGNLHVYVPLFFTNMTKEDVKTFAIANPIVRRLLLPWWFGTRHAGWWRFSAYPEQLTWAGSAV